MSAVIETPAIGEGLTLSQRLVLRATLRGGRLEPARAGGVHALDGNGMPTLPRFPLRTINALVRSGMLQRTKAGWELTSDGRHVAGEG